MTNLFSIIGCDVRERHQRPFVISVADSAAGTVHYVPHKILEGWEAPAFSKVQDNYRKLHVSEGFTLSGTGIARIIDEVFSDFDNIVRYRSHMYGSTSIKSIANGILDYTKFFELSSDEVLNFHLSGVDAQGSLGLIHINTTGNREESSRGKDYAKRGFIKATHNRPVLYDGSGASTYEEFIRPRPPAFEKVRESIDDALYLATRFGNYAKKAMGVNDSLQVSIMVQEGDRRRHGLFIPEDVDLPRHMIIEGDYRATDLSAMAFARHESPLQLRGQFTGFLYKSGHDYRDLKALQFSYTPQTPTRHGPRGAQHATATHRIQGSARPQYAPAGQMKAA